MDHKPRQILSPDGTGIRCTYACTCGEGPSKGAGSTRTMRTWFISHARKTGASVAPADFITAYEAFKSEGSR